MPKNSIQKICKITKVDFVNESTVILPGSSKSQHQNVLKGRRAKGRAKWTYVSNEDIVKQDSPLKTKSQKPQQAGMALFLGSSDKA